MGEERWSNQSLGKSGREFGMLKFHTVHQDVDAVLRNILESNPEKRCEWDYHQKLARDPRITCVRRLLRRDGAC